MNRNKIIKTKKSGMKKSYICTIDTNQLLINRAGKVNSIQNPEIRSYVHKSAKDYNRQKAKKEIRKYIY